MKTKLRIPNLYEIDVSIISNNGCECYGNLILSQNTIQLEISFERSKSRSPNFDSEIEILKCADGSNVYILINSKIVSSSSKHLGQTLDASPSFAKLLYNIECVLKIEGRFGNTNNFYGITIQTDDLAEWIGSTTIQAAMLDNLHDENNRQFEFQSVRSDADIGSCKNFLVAYAPKSHYKNLKTVHELHPCILLQFPITPLIDLPSKIRDVLALMSFLSGKNIQETEIRITLYGGLSCKATAYLIIPPQSKSLSYRKEPFIPLCENLSRLSEYSSPIGSLPIWRYFDNTNDIGSATRDYVKFRDMEISEDRYLGMFRILEKQTHHTEEYFPENEFKKLVSRVIRLYKGKIRKKTLDDFESRVIRLNKNKGSVESSIRKHLKNFTPAMKSYMGIDESILNDLAQLRNDITHSNRYQIGEDKFFSYSIYCQILACSSLMFNLGFPLKTICISVERINAGMLNRRKYSAASLSKLFDENGNLLTGVPK